METMADKPLVGYTVGLYSLGVSYLGGLVGDVGSTIEWLTVASLLMGLIVSSLTAILQAHRLYKRFFKKNNVDVD